MAYDSFIREQDVSFLFMTHRLDNLYPAKTFQPIRRSSYIPKRRLNKLLRFSLGYEVLQMGYSHMLTVCGALSEYDRT